jgi:hypothetical protein
MAEANAIEHWENLVLELSDEPGVKLGPDGLTVGGNLFAFRDENDLIVDLAANRASDLVHRGMAASYKHDGERSRDWVRVSDQSLWSELGREAHEYVGEPPVGGDS